MTLSVGEEAAAEETDCIIVGAGPTGLACGIELKKLGIRAVLMDKGCVVNSLYNYPINMVFFTTPELLEIGGIPMTSLNEKPGRTEALKYYRRVADHFHLDIRQYQTVKGISGEDGNFLTTTLSSSGATAHYRSKKAILATGYYDIPNMLNVPGEHLPKVIHYYKEAHPYFGHDVMVVGGKNSAAISALELFWTGARVTLVHRGAEMHKNIKYWIKPNIENRMKSGEITGHLQSSVVEICEDSVLIQTPHGEKRIKNQFVFAMTGYRPDFEFMSRHGIELDAETQRPKMNKDTLETERKGMFLAGVVVAGIHTNEIFIENGRFHGIQIAQEIANQLALTRR